jgi:hypothetical protein
VLAPYRARGLFQSFPFSTDLTREEQGLREALQHLKRIIARNRLPVPSTRQLRALAAPPQSAGPYLERMGLDAPRTVRDRLLRRVLVYALASADVI